MTVSSAWPASVKAARDRGDWQAVARLAEAEPDNFTLAMEAMRAALGLAQVTAARFWQGRARALAATATDQLELDLEGAQCAIFAALDFAPAIHLFEAESVDWSLIDPDRAPRLRWLLARLALAAAAFQCVPGSTAERAENGLASLFEALAGQGDDWFALCVGLEWLSRCPADQRADVSSLIETHARATDFGGLRASALFLRARHWQQEGRSPEEVANLREEAVNCLQAMGHAMAALHAEKEAVSEGAIDVPTLENLADRFADCGDVKTAVSLLTDASQEAHVQGDRTAALRINTRLRDLAVGAGFGMPVLLAPLREADLAMRAGDQAQARDIIDKALAQEQPDSLKVALAVLKGSALSLAGDQQGALAARETVIRTYVEMGQEASASDLICAHAGDLSADRTDVALGKADALLAEWVALDVASGRQAAAAEKQAMRGSLCVLAALADRQAGRSLRELSLAAQADTHISAAERQILAIPGASQSEDAWDRAIVKAALSVAQYRQQLATLTNDLSSVEAILSRTIRLCDQVALPTDAANARFLLGLLKMNAANGADGDGKSALATEAHMLLSTALAQYDSVGGMRKQAANARRYLGKLCQDLIPFLKPEAVLSFATMAAEFLESALGDLEALRAGFIAGDDAATLAGKSALSGEAAAVSEELLRLHAWSVPDPERYRLAAARSKARALTDLLGASDRRVQTLIAGSKLDEAALALVQQEQRLVAALAAAPAAQRFDLGTRLDALRASMRAEPALAPYLALRTGLGDAVPAIADFAGPEGQAAVFVDWTMINGTIHLMVARSNACPVVERNALRADDIADFVARRLNQDGSFRSTLRDQPHLLETMAALVAPLAHLTQPGEVLFLCPSGLIGALPLHALPVEGVPLLVRNPLVWTPGPGLLARCIAPTAENRRSAVMTFFGDPTLDRAAAAETVRDMAALVGGMEILGQAASIPAFLAALTQADGLHFQGHAVHDRDDPLGSYLVLAGGERLHARVLLEAMDKARVRFVALGACESAASTVKPGDEPYGLVPALLAGGADAVLAAQWKVADAPTAAFMHGFYEALMAGASPVFAVQRAALAVRNNPDYAAPYYWAGFALAGNPWSNPLATGAEERG